MIHLAVLGALLLFIGAGATGVIGPTLQTYEATVRYADGTVGKAWVQRKDVADARSAIEHAYCLKGTPSCILEGPK